jgi:hypothetical protein
MRERDYTIQRERDAGKRMRRYMEKAMKTPEQKAQEAIESVHAAAMPGIINPKLRHDGMAARTLAIRNMLKLQGVKGVSVRKATGSMCFWTYVDLPRVPHTHYAGQSWDICATCQRDQRAKEKVEQMILSAFPDLDDRSDGMTDHSDFVFMVGNK